MRSQARAWLTAGWVVDTVDFDARTVRFVRGEPTLRPTAARQPGATSAPDGAEQLAIVLKAAGYESTMHAVAAHTVFVHPDVVAETAGHALFPTVRALRNEVVGSRASVGGKEVMLDDNMSAIYAFMWAAGQRRGRDVQYNHVWPGTSRDPNAYTAIWNVCLTPSFLAKTTDGQNHPDVTAALQCRSWELFGHRPSAVATTPVRPSGYDTLAWAPHPRPIASLADECARLLARKPRDRLTLACRDLGWLFGSAVPSIV